MNITTFKTKVNWKLLVFKAIIVALAINGAFYLKLQVNTGLDSFAKGRAVSHNLVQGTTTETKVLVPVVEKADLQSLLK